MCLHMCCCWRSRAVVLVGNGVQTHDWHVPPSFHILTGECHASSMLWPHRLALHGCPRAVTRLAQTLINKCLAASSETGAALTERACCVALDHVRAA